MTVGLSMRLLGRLGAFSALGLLLPPAHAAETADADCLGSWRLQVAPPDAEKEAWLSPASWCRARSLPRTLAVEVRRGDDGRLILAGDPLRPTDVLVGAGRCEFRFSESMGGLPKHHELALEANATGAAVHGTARCSEHDPASGGARTGITITLDVTGSHSAGRDDRPACPTKQVTAVVTACRQQDADALWKTMTPRFRSEADRRAAQLRRSLGASALRRLYGHRGRLRAFTGMALLRHALRAGDGPDNPCSGVEHWEVGARVAAPGGWLVTVRRDNGFAFALRFTKDERGCRLDQISKSVQVPKP
jgi:hypothetical protein